MPISKPAKMNPEVQTAMSERLEAHRRGKYQVIGSLSWVETAHGALRFPVHANKHSGPTIGYVTDAEDKPDSQKIIVLTPWEGVPDLQEKTEEFCAACLAVCHVCEGTGSKVCEGVGCGGSGWVPVMLDPGSKCLICGLEGHAGHKVCPMCHGSGKMICSFCRGNKKYSTGIKGGQTDYMQPRCPECQGAQRHVIHKKQDLTPHVNALLPDPAKGPIVAIGPIFSFAVDLIDERKLEFGSPIRVFDVRPDRAGDHLFLLLDPSTSPQWPYLIGGLVIDRVRSEGAVMPR